MSGEMTHLTEFWEATERDVLLGQRCGRCGTLQYYPRLRCTECGSGELEYEQLSGRGVIYSWAEVLRNAPSAVQADVPYVLAIVRLEEGPQLLTRIVDSADPQTLECDAPVEVVFRELGGRRLPCFRSV
jgi:uncharacterized OB-fold protein